MGIDIDRGIDKEIVIKGFINDGSRSYKCS